MKIHLAGDKVYLWGDWTVTEMSFTAVDGLTRVLDRIQAADRKKVAIDCAHLNSVDDSGAKYFYIWLNCLNLRGIEYELVNYMGKQDEFTLYTGRSGQPMYYNPFERKSIAHIKRKRRYADESRRNQGYRPAEAG